MQSLCGSEYPRHLSMPELHAKQIITKRVLQVCVSQGVGILSQLRTFASLITVKKIHRTTQEAKKRTYPILK